jgi:hypothetical protein
MAVRVPSGSSGLHALSSVNCRLAVSTNRRYRQEPKKCRKGPRLLLKKVLKTPLNARLRSAHGARIESEMA